MKVNRFRTSKTGAGARPVLQVETKFIRVTIPVKANVMDLHEVRRYAVSLACHPSNLATCVFSITKRCRKDIYI